MTHPLDNFPVVRTRHVDEMRAQLARIYANAAILPAGRGRQFNIVMNNRQLRHIGISYVKYGAAVDIQFPAVNLFTQKFPLGGNGEIRVRRTLIPLKVGHSEVSCPGETYRSRFDENYEHLIVRIDPAALSRTLQALTGDFPQRPLKVNSAQTFASPEAQSYCRLFQVIVAELSAQALPPLPDAMLAQFEQSLMVLFLNATIHTHSYLLHADPRDVAPRQVRRAEEYIEAHWSGPIMLEDIVAATGASARSMFRAFRKNRGYSPMEFLKLVRLRNARTMLERADHETGVAEVALACGFTNQSRFSRDYCRQFGERPFDVLRYRGISRRQTAGSPSS